MGTWNKSDLVKAVAERTGASKAGAMAYVDATLGVIAQALRDGDGVTLTGFGAWKIKDVQARDRVEPRGGTTIHCPAKRRATWKAAKGLVE